MPEFAILFSSLDKTVTAGERETLLDAAGKAGVTLKGICGGDGICGRCKMIVKEGNVRGDVSMLLTREEVQSGVVLACQTYPESDLVVDIPEETRARDTTVISPDAERFRAMRPGASAREFLKQPLVRKVAVRLDPPTLDDNLADFQRLERALQQRAGITSMQAGLKIAARLPGLLRKHNFNVTATIGRRGEVWEIMDIEGGDTSADNYAVAVDIGTSTIVAHLLNVVDLVTIDAEACFNSQSLYGREITARIIACEKKCGHNLQEMLVGDINRLISALAERNGVNLKHINAVVCSGNTAMMHFLLGLPADNIRRNPFIAATVEPPPFRAAEAGIIVNPRGLLFSVPGISGWVGGDLTAGILVTGLHEMDGIGMLIDIGTNGEIILGNKDWLIACSASTGPALEGASVECGMMAESGAIERVYEHNGRICWKTIGNVPPAGLCGSGIIDLLAVLLDRKIVSRAGKFIKGSDPALLFDGDLGTFTLVSAERTAHGKPVFITQDDIDNVMVAKAAVFSAAKTLLDRLQLHFSDIDRLFIAGGFGSYIDLANAVKIGLLPEMPLANIKFVGNTSIGGAKLAAFSREAWELLHSIRRRTTYYDLLGSQDYVDQFRQATFLPHTQVELFPSAFEESSERQERVLGWQRQS